MHRERRGENIFTHHAIMLPNVYTAIIWVLCVKGKVRLGA